MANQAFAPTIGGQSGGGLTEPAHTQPFVSVTPSTEPTVSVPSRDHGAYCKAFADIPIKAYIDAIGKTMNKANITHASRIPNGCIALYFRSKEMVQLAVSTGLELNDTYVELTPLVLPTQRIVLSNVYPEIPNSLLEKTLSSFCKIVSAFRPIPLGTKESELSHIMSFRRSVNVLINQNLTSIFNRI